MQPAYAKWLSEHTGKGYRLPTEAEWEYAARGGSGSAYWWGDEIGRNRANCRGCRSRWDRRQTAPVGSFAVNGYGLFDTAGNAREWTCSAYAATYGGYGGSEAKCEKGESARRAVRGGGWFNEPAWVRSAFRARLYPDSRNYHLGFRVFQDVR